MDDEQRRALAKRCQVSSAAGWAFFTVIGVLELLAVQFVQNKDNIVLIVLALPFCALWAHGVYISFISALVTEYRTPRVVYVAAANALLFLAVVLISFFHTGRSP